MTCLDLGLGRVRTHELGISANIFETHLHAIGDIGQLSTTEIPNSKAEK